MLYAMTDDGVWEDCGSSDGSIEELSADVDMDTEAPVSVSSRDTSKCRVETPVSVSSRDTSKCLE